jgi:hypothetical protein
LKIATSKNIPHQGAFFCSLMNIIINYDPRGSLPYTSVLSSDTQEYLTSISIELLCLLLHTKDSEYNVLLSKINEKNDFITIYNGFELLLQNLILSNNTYLPSSQKTIEFADDIIVLLWKIFDVNKNLLIYICNHKDVTKILIPLLFTIQINKDDQIKYPLIQIVSFVILLMSGTREFGIALNRSFEEKVPLDLPLLSDSPNYADVLICCLHKFMVQDKGILRNLFDCYLTTICNISPYIKKISMPTSVKIVGLFESFSSKKFLYSAEKNYIYIDIILQIFNNLIQYQYEGSIHLIYTILSKKKSIIELLRTPSDFSDVKVKDENFKPTQEWAKKWRSELPIKTLTTLIKVLSPEVEGLCENGFVDEEVVLKYLKNTTLVGLLPVPHTIIVRTFKSTPQIDTFLTTFLWGLIYLQSLNPPLFDSDHINLFKVNVYE